MKWVAPEGPVYQAGTLSGNPLAVAAGIATLKALKKPGTYAKLEQYDGGTGHRVGRTLRSEPASRCRSTSIGSMFTVFFTASPVTDFQTAKASDTARYAKFFHAMLEKGVYFPPSQFETCFVSLAHTQKRYQGHNPGRPRSIQGSGSRLTGSSFIEAMTACRFLSDFRR